jgi:hypothetical protein
MPGLTQTEFDKWTPVETRRRRRALNDLLHSEEELRLLHTKAIAGVRL